MGDSDRIAFGCLTAVAAPWALRAMVLLHDSPTFSAALDTTGDSSDTRGER